MGRYQFPRHSLQTSPQSLCLVTSPPLRAEGSQPHSSPSKQTTCPESCGMPLSHCLHRVLAAPQDHGLRRDTRQVSCQLPQPGSVNGVSNVLEKLSERQKNVSSSCLPVPCSDPMLYLSCCFFFFLSTKPHPPFLTARSLVDRHIRILFSFERNLDNSRVSLRNMIQPEGWNIFFFSSQP